MTGLLRNRIALIGGGAGEVGEGIVRVFLREDATVVVPSRSDEKLEFLARAVGNPGSERLFLLHENIGKVEGVERVRQEVLSKFGRLNIAVASLGGWWESVKPLRCPNPYCYTSLPVFDDLFYSREYEEIPDARSQLA